MQQQELELIVQGWIKKSDILFEKVPDKSSRFVLQAKAQSGKWYAFVSEEDVDEGNAFSSLLDAQQAAMDAYDSYWADFEDPL